MRSSLEDKADRYINTADKVFKRVEAVVRRGDAVTHIHNRDSGLSDAEKMTLSKNIECTWAEVSFLGSAALHMPGLLVGCGRLRFAESSFGRELARTMPDANERVDRGETDLYTLAAEIAGVDDQSPINHMPTNVDVSIED